MSFRSGVFVFAEWKSKDKMDYSSVWRPISAQRARSRENIIPIGGQSEMNAAERQTVPMKPAHLHTEPEEKTPLGGFRARAPPGQIIRYPANFQYLRGICFLKQVRNSIEKGPRAAQ